MALGDNYIDPTKRDTNHPVLEFEQLLAQDLSTFEGTCAAGPDSVDGTMIDWATAGAGIVGDEIGAESIPLEDAGTVLTAVNVEAALQEMCGATRTVETLDSALQAADADNVDATHIDWATPGAGIVGDEVGAASIPLEDAGGRITATEVETALQEICGAGRTVETLMTAIQDAADTVDTTHIDWATPGAGLVGNEIGAESIPLEDAGALITATDVEAALQEICGVGRTVETIMTAIQDAADTVNTTHIDWAAVGAGLVGDEIGAESIPLEDGGGLIVATEVENALQEIAGNVDDVEMGVVDPHALPALSRMLPFVLTYECVGGGGVAVYDLYNADAPFAFEIVDVVVQCTFTNGGGTVQLDDGVNPITDAIVCAVDHAITRVGTINDAVSTIALNGSLRILTNANTDQGRVTIYCVARP